jgi:hypothetical protein
MKFPPWGKMDAYRTPAIVILVVGDLKICVPPELRERSACEDTLVVKINDYPSIGMGKGRSD